MFTKHFWVTYLTDWENYVIKFIVWFMILILIMGIMLLTRHSISDTTAMMAGMTIGYVGCDPFSYYLISYPRKR